MKILLIIFFTVAGFFTLYLVLLAVLGFIHNLKVKIRFHSDQKENPKKNCFAVIVPAHNEESVIAETVSNLMNIDYPQELFMVFVVADNCTDKTSLYASREGAVVLERENRELQSKGHALQWCFKLLLKNQLRNQEAVKSFDAIFVVDADTTVTGDILEVLNTYLNKGCKAIQCADLVKPNPGAWSSEITRVGLYLYNYVRPLGKKMLGSSAGLRGNGMCFTVDLLRKIPWQAYSQTEDLEYGLILLLNGIPVTFAPEAKVYAVMPFNPRNAESQRARWEFGRFLLIKKYSSILLKEAVKKRSFAILDSFIELITPAFVNLFLFTFLMLAINMLLAIASVPSTNSFLLLWMILLAMQLFYVFGGLYLSGADIYAYKALWYAPKFIFWKLVLYIRVLVRGHTKLWVRTARENVSH